MTKKRNTWDDWYALSQKYQKEHGDLLVPKSYVTADGDKLGNWIAGMRQAKKNPGTSSYKLTEKQEKKLSALGMEWTLNSSLEVQPGKRYQDAWNEKNGLVSKSYKLSADIANAFASACEQKGVSKKAQLEKMMLAFIKEVEEVNNDK